MNYQLLALDMDGTVLNSRKEITPRTGEAIRKALREGYDVLFSTGRNLSEMREYLARFPEMRYAICCSGALVKDLHTGETLSIAPIGFGLVDQVLETVRGMDVNIVYFIGDDLYASTAVRGRLEHYNCQCFHELHEACAIWVEDPCSMALEKPDEILKLNLFFHDPEEYRQACAAFDRQGISHPSGIPYNCEISCPGVNKAAGIQLLCDYLGISMEQAIACGDEGNDREMILVSGLGVAMGNASEPIKRIADVIVADCDHDGVAEVIETYLGKPVLRK